MTLPFIAPPHPPFNRMCLISWLWPIPTDLKVRTRLRDNLSCIACGTSCWSSSNHTRSHIIPPPLPQLILIRVLMLPQPIPPPLPPSFSLSPPTISLTRPRPIPPFSAAMTNMNEHSSRSHMMLTITVISESRQNGVITRGKLNLVDLAGSERLNKSGTPLNKLITCKGTWSRKSEGWWCS